VAVLLVGMIGSTTIGYVIANLKGLYANTGLLREIVNFQEE